MNTLLTKQQLAELLKVSPRTIDRWRAMGLEKDLGVVHLGKRVVRFRYRPIERIQEKGLKVPV